MSNFKKLLLTLIFILIIEIILIYTRYKININKNAFMINNPRSSYTIMVDSTLNVMIIFKDGKTFKSYPVSSGKPSTPSPIGTWKIVSKDTWGEGFGGRWMGFNVPWGKYGIHGTIYPDSIGSSTSKGCIRMRNADVAEVYKFIPYGTPVIIWGGPYGNFGESLRTLKPGMTGSDVYELQVILKEKGYYKDTPNGVYGIYFQNVIKEFQKKNNLPVSDTINFDFYSKLSIKLMD